jgi:2-polyprenyl-3-methyl-5-hydroxy-6-metoxy-1,4-benzoquinol methylase
VKSKIYEKRPLGLKIITYKSEWHYNVKNGVATIVPRNTYPLRILGKLSKRFAIFEKNKEVEKNPSLIYENLKNYKNGAQNFCTNKDLKLQKNRARCFAKILSQNNISLKNKSILDISGGSGMFVKTLQEFGACKTSMTEFSQAAVEYSKNNLKIPSYYFDLQKHSLLEIFPKKTKFDIIMLRGCIEFCIDLNKLAKEVSQISHKNTILVLTFINPTLGVALRTSFDQYNVKICRPPELTKKIFNRNGFNIAVNSEIFLFDRNYAFHHLKSPLYIFYIYYLWRNLVKIRKAKYSRDFHALDCKCAFQIYRRHKT